MDELMRWYVEVLVKVMRLEGIEVGPCYRVADGLYVRAASFEALFGSDVEQTVWMLLRNGDMSGELERWALLVSKHRDNATWLEGTLDNEFIDADLALCYYTEL